MPEARIADFLSMPLAGDAGVVRDGDTFHVTKPWALAHFGTQSLAQGWWILECDAHSPRDNASVEVRLSNAKDPLIVFGAAEAAHSRILLTGSGACGVEVLISPWPGRNSFRQLRLRRLSILETASFLIKGAVRVLRKDRPITRAMTVARRLASGRSVGVNAATRADVAGAEPVSAQTTTQPLEVIEREGLSVFVLQGDRLHPRAFEIAQAAFEDRRVHAVYADAIESGSIIPMPQWDDELARQTAYIHPPIFFRERPDNDPWRALTSIAGQHGGEAVRRISLPLVRRDGSVLFPVALPPVPELVSRPSVSIIIPTKFRVDLLEKCLAGLSNATAYRNFEVVIVDNGCSDPRLGEVIAAAKGTIELSRTVDDRPFNYPALNQVGVARSSGEILLLLNDDIEPKEPDWLTRIIASAERPDVGAVGARLLYPDGTIQHAGVMLGIGGVCGHLWKGLCPEAAARIPQIVLPSRRTALTAACLAVRRSTYEDVGGLDQALPVALNDIDLCLKLHVAGLRNIYRGDAVLTHHESQSRGSDDASVSKHRRLATETALFLSRWGHLLGDDPYGSPAFNPQSESGIAHHSVLRPWVEETPQS